MGHRKLQQSRRNDKAALKAAKREAQNSEQRRRELLARQFGLEEVPEPEFAFRRRKPPPGIDRPSCMLRCDDEMNDYDAPEEGTDEHGVPAEGDHNEGDSTHNEMQVKHEQHVEIVEVGDTGPTQMQMHPEPAANSEGETKTSDMQRKKSVRDKAKERAHQKFEINETPLTEPASSSSSGGFLRSRSNPAAFAPRTSASPRCRKKLRRAPQNP